MGYPIVHFEMMGKDEDALQKFYSAVMGWKIGEDNPMKYRIVDTDADGAGIGGGIGASPDGSNFVTVYAEVPDIQAVLKQVEAAGGKTLVPETEIPDMVTYAHFSDPAGNTIGVVKAQA